jgi:hypothetical protein
MNEVTELRRDFVVVLRRRSWCAVRGYRRVMLRVRLVVMNQVD